MTYGKRRGVKKRDVHAGEGVETIAPDQIADFALILFGPEAPTAIAFCGIDAWMRDDVWQVRKFAEALKLVVRSGN